MSCHAKPMWRAVGFVISLLPVTVAAAPQPTSYPVLVSGAGARPVRRGDVLRVLQLGQCDVRVPRENGIVERATPDSLVLTYQGGHLVVLPGSGEATARFADDIRHTATRQRRSSMAVFGASAAIGAATGVAVLLSLLFVPEAASRPVLAVIVVGAVLGVYAVTSSDVPEREPIADEIGRLMLRNDQPASRCEWTDRLSER